MPGDASTEIRDVRVGDDHVVDAQQVQHVAVGVVAEGADGVGGDGEVFRRVLGEPLSQDAARCDVVDLAADDLLAQAGEEGEGAQPQRCGDHEGGPRRVEGEALEQGGVAGQPPQVEERQQGDDESPVPEGVAASTRSSPSAVKNFSDTGWGTSPCAIWRRAMPAALASVAKTTV